MDILNRLRRKLAVRRLRGELAYWGIDTSDMNDEEFAERMAETHKALVKASRQMALTANEAAQAFQNLGQAMRKAGPLDDFLIPRPGRLQA